MPQTRIDAEFERFAALEGRGGEIRVWCAFFGAILAAGPMSWVEFSWAPLFLFSIARLWPARRVHRLALMQPAMLLFWAWLLWVGASVLWTPDRKLWLIQGGTLRWGLAALILYPVLRHRAWLIAAIALSFVGLWLSQIITAIAVPRGWHLPWPTFPDRNGGWSVPVVAGTMLVACLGLHLPAAVMGRGGVRVVACLASLASIAAIIVTGTRGAWLAALGLVAIVVAVAVWRLGGARRWRALAAALVILVVGAGAAWFTSGDAIARRWHTAVAEVDRAVREGDYNSDNGARILMARWAWEAFKEHPIRGIGVGGFRAWVEQHEANLDAKFKEHGHCHNALLQTAATSGIPGVLLLGGILAYAIIGGVRGVNLGSYQAAPAFALIGMILTAPFDVFELNGQTAALMYLLIALCPMRRPPLARPEAVSDEFRRVGERA